MLDLVSPGVSLFQALNATWTTTGFKRFQIYFTTKEVCAIFNTLHVTYRLHKAPPLLALGCCSPDIIPWSPSSFFFLSQLQLHRCDSRCQWSLPMPVDLHTLLPFTDFLNGLFTSTSWAIWFLVLPSGDTHVTLCTVCLYVGTEFRLWLMCSYLHQYLALQAHGCPCHAATGSAWLQSSPALAFMSPVTIKASCLFLSSNRSHNFMSNVSLMWSSASVGA